MLDVRREVCFQQFATDGRGQADQGFTIAGAVTNEVIGTSVAGAGDVNGDGIDDVVVGASGGDRAYVVYGANGGLGNIDVGNLAPSEGFKIVGIPDFSTNSVNSDSAPLRMMPWPAMISGRLALLIISAARRTCRMFGTVVGW